MDWLSQLKKHLDKIGLALILLFLFYQNFSPGTWLTGWDNLMPELNIGMNLQRSFLAVWQQYQGLGLVGGMSHSTDLIRQLILLPFTIILPQDFIRYFWHFLTLALGTFGIYFGLKKQFKLNKAICFLSALFYLLNFGTVQNYWAAFEPLSTFWGLFPWLIFSLWEYLDKTNKKNLIKLIIFNLLAIPSFYVPTIFVVYLFCIFAILISHLIKNRPVKGDVRRTEGLKIKIILIILALNSFWLIPFVYFLKNDVQNPQLGIGNLMANQETFDRNQARGNISDFLLLRGYYYDFPDSGSFLMSAWRQHFSQTWILVLSYSLSSIVIFGLIYSIIKFKKNSFQKTSLLIIFFICATALLSNTQPFSFLNYLIRQISIFDQVFRSPFTKFIVPAIFCFTLFFAFGLEFIAKITKKFKPLFYSLIFIIIIISSFPSFTGNFFYPKTRQSIPNDYLTLINFFKKQPKTDRIANLPSGSFWGWTNYRFGIRGSGFIWYGIQQPILDRAFDVWNLKNEQYYWELNYAIQKQDPNLLQNVLDKYSVSYVLFDNNIFFPDEVIYSKNAIQTREMLSKMPNLSLAGQFGQIYVYKNKPTSPVFLLNNPVSIDEPNYFYQDLAFQNYGNYISNSNPDIKYPFANLFTNRLPSENKFQISATDQEITIKNPLNNLETKVSTANSLTFQNPIQSDLAPLSNQNNSQEIISQNNESFIRLTSKSQNNLFAKFFPDLSFDQTYLIKISYRHLNNYPLIVSAFSSGANHVFFNTQLEKNKQWQTAWFVLPKYDSDSFNKGLTILFNNTSFNNQSSINDIKNIKIYPFSYDDLINTKIITKPIDQTSSQQNLSSISNIFFYRVKLDQNLTSNSYLVLSQSFHKGWLAFYFNGPKPTFLKNHTLVNNWENGWLLPSTTDDQTSTIYILFWPQILEFIGFGLLIIPIISIIKKK